MGKSANLWHAVGYPRARDAIEYARIQVSTYLGAFLHEIIFVVERSRRTGARTSPSRIEESASIAGPIVSSRLEQPFRPTDSSMQPAPAGTRYYLARVTGVASSSAEEIASTWIGASLIVLSLVNHELRKHFFLPLESTETKSHPRESMLFQAAPWVSLSRFS